MNFYLIDEACRTTPYLDTLYQLELNKYIITDHHINFDVFNQLVFID